MQLLEFKSRLSQWVVSIKASPYPTELRGLLATGLPSSRNKQSVAHVVFMACNYFEMSLLL